MKFKWMIVLLMAAALIITACTDSDQDFPNMQQNGGQSGQPGGMMDDSQMDQQGGQQEPGRPIKTPEGRSSTAVSQGIANGERIYFTAANQEGERIPYSGGPDFGGMMMGSYLTCASCHGPQAHGGEHVMNMQVMDAPPIYGEALSGHSSGDHSEGEDSNHEDERSETDDDSHETGEDQESYSLDTFRMAVVEGKHPDGEPLGENMPRWNMSDHDLADLLAFLKSIPE